MWMSESQDIFILYIYYVWQRSIEFEMNWRNDSKQTDVEWPKCSHEGEEEQLG